MESQKYIGIFEGYIRLIEVNETATDFKILLKMKAGTQKNAKPLISSLQKEHNAVRVMRMKDIPGYKAMKRLRKKKEIEQQELDKISRMQAAVAAFKEYSQDFTSEAKALLHLIQYLNRYAKSFPKYKFASQGNRAAVRLIYSLKDQWIEANKTLITSAVIANETVKSWIDWDILYRVRETTGEWQNPNDYVESCTQRVYAYEFDVEGEIVKFHSHIAVVQGELEHNPNATGKAKPLTKEERAAMPLMEALYLVCGGLKEDPARRNSVTDVEPSVSYQRSNYWDY